MCAGRGDIWWADSKAFDSVHSRVACTDRFDRGAADPDVTRTQTLSAIAPLNVIRPLNRQSDCHILRCDDGGHRLFRNPDPRAKIGVSVDLRQLPIRRTDELPGNSQIWAWVVAIRRSDQSCAHGPGT